MTLDGPTVGSEEGCVSYGRGTPVRQTASAVTRLRRSRFRLFTTKLDLCTRASPALLQNSELRPVRMCVVRLPGVEKALAQA